MAAAPPNLWVIRPSLNGDASKRLFCIPFAGGGASIYRPWANLLGLTVEVCPIQLPGREGRLFESPLTQIDALVALLKTQISPYLDRPYAIYGHSMGALITYELAHAIAVDDSLNNPERIFVAAHRAPHLPPQRPPISALPDNAFIEKLKQYGGFNDEILNHAEMMELVLPTIRADFKLCESYEHRIRQKLNCPIHVFAGTEDTQTLVETTHAWDQCSTTTVTSTLFNGGHFFLNTCQQKVIEAIKTALLS